MAHIIFSAQQQYDTMTSSATLSCTLTALDHTDDTPDWKRHSCSAFLAGDVVVEVVPSFSIEQSLELLSVPRLPPLRAGVSSQVPLWLALLLEKRNLGKIQPPEWLSVDNLKQVLKWEQTEDLFSPHLPFYWQVIARSLAQEESVKILLQDISEIRMDKIRRNIHALSQQSLSQSHALPFIDVTGIGALELAAIHSFVTTAFHHHLVLSRPTYQKNTSAQETRQQAMQQTTVDNEEEEVEEEETSAPRLRRFR